MNFFGKKAWFRSFLVYKIFKNLYRNTIKKWAKIEDKKKTTRLKTIFAKNLVLTNSFKTMFRGY